MTEHSKIPLPEDGAPGARKDGGEGRTLIERAVKAFDLGALSARPLPENLPPRPVKPAMRNRGAEASAAPPPQVPADLVNNPTSEAAEPASAPITLPALHLAPPVRFGAARHPIDRELLREQGMIVPDAMVSGLIEEFRIVKRQILSAIEPLREQGMGSACQRVLVCSPLPGEGKTFTAVNLALAIAAEKESDVLLVDADFAKPSVLSVMGLPGGPGLMDALADPAVDVAECVMGTDVPGLWVLPAGNATSSDSEFLSSSRTAAVLDRLTQGAPNRVVIFDSPPALAASPAAELAKHVGQAVLVARADWTGQRALEDAVSLLGGCPNIRLLLNAVHFSPSGRRFGSYYGYEES